MDVHEGFIVGIYNYCDRWCEVCPLTSRCRVFADRAEMEAAADPNLQPVADAPPLPEEIPPPPPPWTQELIEQMNDAAREPLTPSELEALIPRVREEHQPIEMRARHYCSRALRWLDSHDYASVTDPADPRSVIGWFAYYIPPKVYRALSGLASGWPETDGPPDYDGSAKAALIAIDRSHAAWLATIDAGLASMADVSAFIGALVWLGEALERVFPRARAFVRPGFDEPDEVARLMASEER